VALSGLDGAGKSTQAAALADALDALGSRPRIVWAPIGNNWPVAALATLGKRLTRRRGPRSAEAHASSVPAGPGGLVAAGWVTLVGVAHAAAQLRTRFHVLTGRVAICDRYVLDTAVHLLHRYGDTRAVRAQIRLVSLVTPEPSRAYFIDVPPQLARARKADRWTTSHLTRRAALYRELHERFGVRRVDGNRPSAEITTELVREVCEFL
jgi:thymidylate kinase